VQLRMYFAELLLRLCLWIVPKNHPEGINFIKWLHSYSEFKKWELEGG